MWSDSTAFISFAPAVNSYASLVNDYRIPVKGVGSIKLKVNGYILQLHNVYYIPDLQYCLYLMKQHQLYLNCSCLFDNDAATLSFPHFNVNTNEDHDMLICAVSLKHKASKIHWSSMDGSKSSGFKVSDQPTPHALPYHKPNLSKQS